MKKSWEPFRIYQLTSTANPAYFHKLAVLVSSQDFPHTFSMALYHKWDVKNDFAYVVQFFLLISDSLGSVIWSLIYFFIYANSNI